MRRSPFIAVARHRIHTDGDGVITLCCFYGCPLRCKYCINPQSFSDETKPLLLTPNELYERVKIDDLYFLATDGGVTFGGGEPLLYAEFIEEFRKLCGPRWKLYAETSLYVPLKSVELAAKTFDGFFVDIKDTDPVIYKNYTGRSNTVVLENLARLLELVPPERITVRVPLIRAYNTESDRKKSVALLRDMGVQNFDLFEYIAKSNK